MLTPTMPMPSSVPFASVSEVPESEPLYYEILESGEKVERIVGTRAIGLANRLHTRMVEMAPSNARDHVFMEMLFQMSPKSKKARRPDLAYVSKERWDSELPDVDAWEMVPDLAVEIISKSNSADEIQEKVSEYFAAGVRQVWIVYPRLRQIVVSGPDRALRTLYAEDSLESPELLPGFRLIVGDFLQEQATSP